MQARNRGLIVMDGLKTNAEWESLSHLDRASWCARLDPTQIVAQASVRAAAARVSVRQILDAWIYHGYISETQRAQARALEG